MLVFVARSYRAARLPRSPTRLGCNEALLYRHFRLEDQEILSPVLDRATELIGLRGRAGCWSATCAADRLRGDSAQREWRARRSGFRDLALAALRRRCEAADRRSRGAYLASTCASLPAFDGSRSPCRRGGRTVAAQEIDHRTTQNGRPGSGSGAITLTSLGLAAGDTAASARVCEQMRGSRSSTLRAGERRGRSRAAVRQLVMQP